VAYFFGHPVFVIWASCPRVCTTCTLSFHVQNARFGKKKNYVGLHNQTVKRTRAWICSGAVPTSARRNSSLIQTSLAVCLRGVVRLSKQLNNRFVHCKAPASASLLYTVMLWTSGYPTRELHWTEYRLWTGRWAIRRMRPTAIICIVHAVVRVTCISLPAKGQSNLLCAVYLSLSTTPMVLSTRVFIHLGCQ